MESLASEILKKSAKRAVAGKKYKEEVYGEAPKTAQSGGIRVDKRKFNKGRPKKAPEKPTGVSDASQGRKVVNPLGKDIVSPPVPPKKMNAIEKLAGQIIGGYIRSKLDAMDLQPAIYSDLIGQKIREKLDKDQSLNISAIIKGVEKVEKRRGRPVGAKDKAPRKKKE